jgi:hypothetical protein
MDTTIQLIKYHQLARPENQTSLKQPVKAPTTAKAGTTFGCLSTLPSMAKLHSLL